MSSSQALSSSIPETRLLEKMVSGRVSFPNPVDDFLGLGRILQLNTDRAVDDQGLDFAQVGGEINNTVPGRQIAVNAAVTVAQMDVNRLAGSSSRAICSPRLPA
jgi:hypothetical protein